MNHILNQRRLVLGAMLSMSVITAPVMAQNNPGSVVCNADPGWITNPSLPTDVKSDDNCSFQQFMWQSMLYLVQPVSSGSKVLQFETFMPSYGIFVGPDRNPTPWGQIPVPDFCAVPGSNPLSKAMAKNAGVTLKASKGQKAVPLPTNTIFSNLTLQAGVGQPLIDKSLNRVFYNVSVNKPAYDFITGCDLHKAQCSLSLAPDLPDPAGLKIVDIPTLYPNLAFPQGAIELKTSWKILTADEIASNTFYMTNGVVKSPIAAACQFNQTLGLVGMHIVSKTPTHPEFIWATFEHRNNAPTCAAPTAPPPLGGNWTFYDSACGSKCTTNHYAEGKPTQVCTMHPWGDPTAGTMPNNLSCSSTPPPGYICDPNTQKYVIQPNTANLIAIDKSVQAMLGALPAGNANKLWANYSLVGNVWTARGTLPPSLTVQAGSLSGANNSMETYVQNGVSNIQNPYNCFSCHNLNGKSVNQTGGQAAHPVQLPPAGLSHIFNLLNTKTKGCSTGALPGTPACSANGGPALKSK